MLTNEKITEAIGNGISSAISAIRDTDEELHNSSEQKFLQSAECQPETV